MQCKKAQEVLLTRYLDKEIDSKEQATIEEHLAVCPGCREFLEAVKLAAVVPFEGAPEMRPDDVVWQRIQEKIAAKEAHLWGWLERLADVSAPWLRAARPVFGAAFVTALVLLVVVLARWPFAQTDPVYGYMSEQTTFLSDLGAGDTDLLNGDFAEYDVIFDQMIG